MTKLEEIEASMKNPGVFLTPYMRLEDLHKDKIRPEVYQIFTINDIPYGDDDSTYIYHCTMGINLASSDEEDRWKAVNTFVDAIYKSIKNSVKILIFHPGSGSISNLVKSLKDIANILVDEGIDLSENDLTLAIENMAGDYDRLMMHPEEFVCLADILAYSIVEGRSIKDILNLNMAIDTAHLHAAGYEPDEFLLRTKNSLFQVVAVHFNDSAEDKGKEKDNHAWPDSGKMDKDHTRRFLELLQNNFFLIGIPIIVEM